MARTFADAFASASGPRFDLAVGYSVEAYPATPADPAVTAAFEDFDGLELMRLARRLAGRQKCQIVDADDAVQDALIELWGDRPELFRESPAGWMGLLHEVARRSLGAVQGVMPPASIEAELETGDHIFADAQRCTAEAHGSDEDCRLSSGPMVGEAWTRGQVLGAIQRFRDHHGRAPRVADFRAINGLPSTSVLYRHFDSIAEALLCAGMTPDGPVSRRRRWPPLAAARECRAFRRRNLRWPGWKDVKRRPGELPSTSVMVRCFGGTREIDVQLGAEAILAAVGEPTA